MVPFPIFGDKPSLMSWDDEDVSIEVGDGNPFYPWILVIEFRDEMYGRILLPSTDGAIPSTDCRIHQWNAKYTTIYLMKSVGLF